MLSTFNLGPDIIMDSQYDGGIAPEEADVTMVSYMLQAAECGKAIILMSVCCWYTGSGKCN